MTTIEELKKEIELIKQRNKRVETDNPLENAIVPSIAFVLSTLSGPFVKKFWLEKIHKK